MAAHEYWRLNVTATRAGDTGVSATEIEMRASVGGADECAGGTAFASDSLLGFGAGPPADAFDNNNGTFWTAAGGAFPKSIGYQFASPVDVKEIAWRAVGGSDGRNRAPWVAALQWSDDGASWTTAATWYATDWIGDQTKLFRVPQADDAGVRFFRARITDTLDNSIVQCIELKAYVAQDASGTDIFATAQLDSESNNGGTLYPPSANDGSAGTMFMSGSGTLPVNIYAHTAAAYPYIGAVKYTANAGSDGVNRAPTDVTFESSPTGDPNGTWTELWTETGLSWSSSETKTFVNPSAPGPVAASLVLTPATATLAPAATQQLTAVVYDAEDAEIEGAEVTWDSSNDAVATVSVAGLVTAVADGSATITATSGSASDTTAITVATPAPSTGRSQSLSIGLSVGL